MESKNKLIASMDNPMISKAPESRNDIENLRPPVFIPGASTF